MESLHHIPSAAEIFLKFIHEHGVETLSLSSGKALLGVGG